MKQSEEAYHVGDDDKQHDGDRIDCPICGSPTGVTFMSKKKPISRKEWKELLRYLELWLSHTERM